MARHAVLLVVAVLVSLAVNANADFRTDAWTEHNKFRRIHQVPDLVLDDSLSYQAQLYANELAKTGRGLVHSNSSSRPNQGENLAAGYGYNYSIFAAVDNFYSESSLYNYSRPGFSVYTGHFTQLVWKSSVKLGVGQATNLTSQYQNYQVFRYSPPGNYANLFPQNVLPPRSANATNSTNATVTTSG